MGFGPKIKCDKCGRMFFGGKKYEVGEKNYCYECIVPMFSSISEEEFNDLGVTQKGYFGIVKDMGGIVASGGEEYWINLLKKNAGELDEMPINTDNPVYYIMDMLEKIKKDYEDSDGNSLLLGGLDSYTSPEKIMNVAEKYNFIKYKTFNSSDKQIIDDVKQYLSQGRVVAIAAWTEENRIDMWIESEQNDLSNKSSGCFIATAVYGSYGAPEVIILRNFRDKVLLSTRIGKYFVRLYYIISPSISQFIDKHKFTKKIVKLSLLDPILRRIS